MELDRDVKLVMTRLDNDEWTQSRHIHMFIVPSDKKVYDATNVAWQPLDSWHSKIS